MRLRTPEVEILYIVGSNRDNRRRVLVRYEGTENTIYQDDLADTKVLSLIGVEAGSKELELIQQFFNIGR